MKRIRTYGLLVAALIFGFACVHDPYYIVPNEQLNDNQVVVTSSKSCDPDTVYFQNQILPIFVGSCAVTGCHDAATHDKGLALVNYTNIIKGIVPGNPGRSKFYKVITLTETDDLMPRNPLTEQGFRLPADKIALIEKWIRQNAPNNYCEFCDTSNYSFSDRILPLIGTNCATSIGCHASGSKNGSFTSYAEIIKYVDNGYLMDRAIVKKDMPPSGPLPDCEAQAIINWIEQGAMNN